jgi:hypothetical protein
MAGDIWNAGTAGTGVVWDSRNNGIAYVLDYNGAFLGIVCLLVLTLALSISLSAVIRVVNFAYPSSPMAVTTLVLPAPYTSFTSNSGSPLTSSLCGDQLNPQTLYLPKNSNGRDGLVLAIKLDFTSGALDDSTASLRQARQTPRVPA